MFSLPHSVLIDNLCMDLQGLTYHFLSSAQGGTISFVLAQKSGMTVIFLDSISLGIKLDWHSRPAVTIVCLFEDPTHALHVYNDIYQYVPLNVINSLPIDIRV